MYFLTGEMTLRPQKIYNLAAQNESFLSNNFDYHENRRREFSSNPPLPAPMPCTAVGLWVSICVLRWKLEDEVIAAVFCFKDTTRTIDWYSGNFCIDDNWGRSEKERKERTIQTDIYIWIQQQVRLLNISVEWHDKIIKGNVNKQIELERQAKHGMRFITYRVMRYVHMRSKRTFAVNHVKIMNLPRDNTYASQYRNNPKGFPNPMTWSNNPSCSMHWSVS